jgi:hypothetical protein
MQFEPAKSEYRGAGDFDSRIFEVEWVVKDRQTLEIRRPKAKGRSGRTAHE